MRLSLVQFLLVRIKEEKCTLSKIRKRVSSSMKEGMAKNSQYQLLETKYESKVASILGCYYLGNKS